MVSETKFPSDLGYVQLKRDLEGVKMRFSQLEAKHEMRLSNIEEVQETLEQKYFRLQRKQDRMREEIAQLQSFLQKQPVPDRGKHKLL